ncbi:MAG: hypothetical protein AAGB29_10295 [Planctomycetota bacterium]
MLSLASFVVAAAIWLPSAHLFFAPPHDAYRTADGRPGPRTQQLVDWHLHLWADPMLRRAEIDRMRRSNAEWDFMGRTFLVMALANLAEREPQRRDELLGVADAIIDETLALEAEYGHLYFLMPYARDAAFLADPPRSVFVDGEIAMMLACRQLIADNPAYRQPLRDRVAIVVEAMSAGPIGSAESYPDEGWLFCNALAAAAVRVSDAVTGDDHAEFLGDWLAATREHLTDPATGLLVSRFTYDGRTIEGPEGTCLWLAAHCLQLIDPVFAEQQYHLTRDALARDFLGFGYAREWPTGTAGHADVDSGPIVPVLEASAGSSGLAVLGAAAFDDERYLRQLLTALEAVAFPIESRDGLRFAASNQVGDAVMLYALVQGPLWQKTLDRVGPAIDDGDQP